jgi:hypothetical protein
MHSLFLLTLLGAAAATTEPVVIEIPAHALATAVATKTQRATPDLTDRAAHAMRARIDADGRVHYDCGNAADTLDFRFATRVTREEK